MKKVFITFAVLFSCALPAITVRSNGGGVIVGNGAGSMENHFQYAYQSLATLSLNCLKNTSCHLGPEELDTLENIKSIVLLNINKRDRIIFLSEKQNPGFFTTGESEENRIAKTGLTPEAPIYVNTDLLYENGKPALSYKRIIALLIHELGHQAGNLDHAYLDVLGIKLAQFSEIQTAYHSFKVSEYSGDDEILFTLTNFDYPEKNVQLLFKARNQNISDFSNALISSVSCSDKDGTYKGMTASNGHYTFDKNNNLFFIAWLKVYCLDQEGNTKISTHNLTVALDQNFNFLSLLVN